MKQQAFQAGSISESIVGFAQFMRSHGFNAGIQETQEALLCAKEGLLTDKEIFRYSMKAIFCKSPEERLTYEKLFLLFWNTNPTDLKESKSKISVQGSVSRKPVADRKSVVHVHRGARG